MKNITVKSYSDSVSLIYAIVFFIVGALLFSNPGGIVKFISYIIGGLLIIAGIFKLLHYFNMKKKMLVPAQNDFVIGLISLILGIVSIICSGAIETAIRFIMGGWILFSGINRLTMAFSVTKTRNIFIPLLIASLLMIGVGLYVILKSNLVFSMIGLLIMIYSVIEIVGYITYRRNNA